MLTMHSQHNTKNMLQQNTKYKAVYNNSEVLPVKATVKVSVLIEVNSVPS